jgi:hypothetical protein
VYQGVNAASWSFATHLMCVFFQESTIIDFCISKQIHEKGKDHMLHWITGTRDGFLVLLVIAFVLALGVYVLPVLMAWSLGSPYRMSITVLDILLGWTVLGWLAALIWAVVTGKSGSFDEDDATDQQTPWSE